MTRLTVPTARPYDVLIGPGLLDEAGALLCQAFGQPRVAVVADDVVDRLFGDRLSASLAGAGLLAERWVFPHGETSKSLDTLSDLLEWLAERRLTRTDLVIALGGGVTGDLAGLAAALYLRGVRCVQMPTTLLAAIDSSVGGKTAVDLQAGKNLCGVFSQPDLVLCDTQPLAALPEEIFIDGAAEGIKYGMLRDPALLPAFSLPCDPLSLPALVRRCVAIKAELVAADEFDNGARQLLNLGHTLGHAVERLSGYTLSHGRGVAIGMALMASAADRLGLSREPTLPPLRAALDAAGLPCRSPYPPKALCEAALGDKKRRGDDITLVVPEAVGCCRLETIPVSQLLSVVTAGWEGCQ